MLRTPEVLQQPPFVSPTRILRHLIPSNAKQLRIYQPEGPNEGAPTSHYIGVPDAGEYRRAEQRSFPRESVLDQQLRF